MINLVKITKEPAGEGNLNLINDQIVKNHAFPVRNTSIFWFEILYQTGKLPINK